MSAARVGEQSAVVWNWLKRRPLSASRWKLGVWIGPPKVLVAPKPTSSVRISRTLGAPAGASTPFGKSGVESLTVRPIFPSNGGSGFGNTLASWDAAERGSAVDATADAAMREVEPSKRRRLILIPGEGTLDSLSEPSLIIVMSSVALATAQRHRSFGIA